MRPNHILVVLVFVALMPLRLESQIELRLASGRALTGQLRALSLTTGLRLAPATGTEQVLPLVDVSAIYFSDPRVRNHDSDSSALQFDLAGGDLVFGEVIDGDFDQVQVESDTGRIDLPLDRIQGVRVLANSAGLAPELTKDLPQDRDVVLVRSGTGVDKVVGEVARFAKIGVWFNWTGEEESLFSYRKDRVVAVRLGQPLPPEPLTGVFARVHFRDGSRLSGRVTKEEGGPLILVHPFGFQLDLDADHIAAITFHGGSLVHLSELKSASFVETPYLEGGLRYGMKQNESLKGGSLSIGSSWFPMGLSVHSRSEVSYALEPGSSSFSCAFGVDGRVASARVKGSIAFSVLLDGKLAFGPVIARAGDEPRFIEGLDLSAARSITLRADFADNHHFNGWAVWGSPVIARTGQSR